MMLNAVAMSGGDGMEKKGRRRGKGLYARNPEQKRLFGMSACKALMRQRRNECAEFEGNSMAHCVQFDRLLQSN